jgi:UDP-2,4-diacetamido-2,4,6-trideoxy-beta-L-altropyranose hydrolase
VTWLFRVASRPEVGAGHISRCRSLAYALRKLIPVVFMLDIDGQHWRGSLEADGFEVLVEGQENDREWSGVVLDHYEFDADAADALAAKAGPLAFMDDNLKPPAAAALSINGSPQLTGTMVDNVPALLGSKYAIVAPSFIDRKPTAVKQSLQHIVVTFGGRDSNNVTNRVIDVISAQISEKFAPRVSVVMTRSSLHLGKVSKAIAAASADISLHLDHANMADLLSGADLVIGAGGVSLLERMALGIPSISISTAMNQSAMLEGAAELGATIYLGTHDVVSNHDIATALREIGDAADARRAMARSACNAVDGNGASHIAAKLLELSEQHGVAHAP